MNATNSPMKTASFLTVLMLTGVGASAALPASALAAADLPASAAPFPVVAGAGEAASSMVVVEAAGLAFAAEPMLLAQANAQPDFGDLFVPYKTAPTASDTVGTGVGKTPVPTPQEVRKYESLVADIVDPENTLDIVVNRPRVLVLSEPPIRVQVPDEDIASFLVVSETEVSVYGKEVGNTILNIWFPNDDDPSRPRILSYMVRVLPDPEARAREERVIEALEAEINAAFPESQVDLVLVGGKIVVNGQAKDIREASEIIGLIDVEAEDMDLSEVPISAVDASAAANTGGETLEISDFVVSHSRRIVNRLKIPGETQIMLRVMIAEVVRGAGRSLGVNWSYVDNEGDFSIANLTGNLLDNANIPFEYISGDGHEYRFAVNAMRNLNMARTLAEPTLTTLNGRKASFNSGGQFPVPVISGSGGGGSNLQGVDFEDFGLQLDFTPYVISEGRIRLLIDFEASTRQMQTGTQVGGSSVSGKDIRSFSNTVELRQNQTLAVAGLVMSSVGSSSQRWPFVGDLPIVGPLFGVNSTSNNEQELLMLVSPSIVYPMEPGEIPPLPGSDVFEPTDVEFFFLNQLESRNLFDWRSAARSDIYRQWASPNYPNYMPPTESPLERIRRSENMLISGPSGHTNFIYEK